MERDQRGRRYVKVRIGTVVLAAALVIASGFVHVVCGGGVGLDVCAKDGWTLTDTFVDVDDYAGQPMIALLPKAKVVRALLRCEVIRSPALERQQFTRRLTVELPGASRHAKIETDGDVIVIVAPSEDCPHIRTIVKALASEAPEGQRVRCDTRLAVPWELEERGGAMVDRTR